MSRLQTKNLHNYLIRHDTCEDHCHCTAGASSYSGRNGKYFTFNCPQEMAAVEGN